MKPVGAAHQDALLSILLQAPVEAGGMSVCFDKSPDLFQLPRWKYRHNQHVGFFDRHELKGFGSVGYFQGLVEGKPENLFSLYHFYLLPEARGKQLPLQAMEYFFASARQRANYGISVTMQGNRAVESYIGKQEYDWMPPTRIIDRLVVNAMLFAAPKKNETPFRVRRARYDDLPDILALLREEHRQRDFGLRFELGSFLYHLSVRGLSIEDYFVATHASGVIRGVCLPWDMSPYRRTRVLSYHASLYPSLMLYKAMAAVFPMAPFPEPGGHFRELTLTDWAVSGRDPAIMHALLSEIYHQFHRGTYHFMHWGSCGSDPVLSASAGFRSRQIVSHILFTSFNPQLFNRCPHLPFVDIAFL